MKFVATKTAEQLDLRYLRKLFVQAAWVVLVKIRPEQRERYGLTRAATRGDAHDAGPIDPQTFTAIFTVSVTVYSATAFQPR
jgi:hypothetical protein